MAAVRIGRVNLVQTVLAWRANWMDGTGWIWHDGRSYGDAHAYDATDYAVPFATNTIKRGVSASRRTQGAVHTARIEHEGGRATSERLSLLESDGEGSGNSAWRGTGHRTGGHWHLFGRSLSRRGHHARDRRRVTGTLSALVCVLRRMLRA